MRLPRTIAFDETAFPELLAIFADIDTAIATMVATDPGFQPRGTVIRRNRKAKTMAATPRRHSQQRVAA